MIEKIKKIWSELWLPLLGATAFMGALFVFALLCGVFLMDYDPRIMLDGIAQDLKNIFG